jgi:hypothetical protein
MELQRSRKGRQQEEGLLGDGIISVASTTGKLGNLRIGFNIPYQSLASI